MRNTVQWSQCGTTYRHCAGSQHPVQSCLELVTPESNGTGRLRLERTVLPACNREHHCTGQVRWAATKLEPAPTERKFTWPMLAATGHWDVLGCIGMCWDARQREGWRLFCHYWSWVQWFLRNEKCGLRHQNAPSTPSSSPG